MLDSLLALAPSSFKRYFEPFVGGGALFFRLAPARSTIGDSNERLIRSYRGIQTNPERVVRLLGSYSHSKSFFAKIRAIDIDSADDEHVAAWLIYLNKTGFNGLYRVNSRNIFNVPFGRHSNPNICDAATIRHCANVLQGVTIISNDFEKTVASASKGDFVYFDPPYVPVSASSNFTTYTRTGFTVSDHERLRDVALRLKRRGVHVLLSNSAAPLVSTLYERDFELIPVQARRRMNSVGARRGPVGEYIIR